jgi:5'-3' exonuclease
MLFPRTHNHWAGPCKRLLEIFGFMIHEVSVMIRVLSCWPLITGLMHQAPGEAEAELAKLNAVGLVDAVFTSDSDALVFGARCVIRRLVIRRSVALINLMIH